METKIRNVKKLAARYKVTEEYYRECREKGVCVRCPNKSHQGKALCYECIVKDKGTQYFYTPVGADNKAFEYGLTVEQFAYRKQNGICINCGKHGKSLRGYVCVECVNRKRRTNQKLIANKKDFLLASAKYKGSAKRRECRRCNIPHPDTQFFFKKVEGLEGVCSFCSNYLFEQMKLKLRG